MLWISEPGLQPGFALFVPALGWAEKRRCDSLRIDYTSIPEEWQITVCSWTATKTINAAFRSRKQGMLLHVVVLASSLIHYIVASAVAMVLRSGATLLETAWLLLAKLAEIWYTVWGG